MTDLRTAAQQALEALENTSPLRLNMESDKKFYAAIIALRAALAQDQAEPAQESVPQPGVWMHPWPPVKAQQAEPVQEPVAWRYKPMIGSPWSLSDDGYYVSCKRDKGYIVESLYTAPPQRKPLTKEEIDVATAQERDALLDHIYEYGTAAEGVLERIRKLCRAVERAHGIKE